MDLAGKFGREVVVQLAETLHKDEKGAILLAREGETTTFQMMIGRYCLEPYNFKQYGLELFDEPDFFGLDSALSAANFDGADQIAITRTNGRYKILYR